MNKFLVFDIGCLECGEDSQPLGFYDTKKKAETYIDVYLDDNTAWGRPEWHGQHSVEIFEVEL